MSKSNWLLAAALSLSLPALAHAGDMRGPAAHAEKRQEVRQDQREARDDRRDTKQIESLLSRYDAARARNNRGALQQVESELRAYVKSELSESRTELASARVDARTDHDRRDRRDSAQDARSEADSLRQTRDIARELDGLYGRMDPRSVQRKRTLMADLVRLAQSEQSRDRMETHQDRNKRG